MHSLYPHYILKYFHFYRIYTFIGALLFNISCQIAILPNHSPIISIQFPQNTVDAFVSKDIDYRKFIKIHGCKAISKSFDLENRIDFECGDLGEKVLTITGFLPIIMDLRLITLRQHQLIVRLPINLPKNRKVFFNEMNIGKYLFFASNRIDEELEFVIKGLPEEECLYKTKISFNQILRETPLFIPEDCKSI